MNSLSQLQKYKITNLRKYAKEQGIKGYSSRKLKTPHDVLNLIISNNKYLLQQKGLERNTVDKFYTAPFIVDECIKQIKKKLNIDSSDIIIEPSAGNGSFINGIKSLSSNCYFYDIEPECNSIIKQDYFEFDYTSITNYENEKYHVIGNPPFGRQSSLAIKFIKKSCEYCDSISFILPKSFKKDSLKKHFPPRFHLVFESELPNNSFVVNDKPHNVPCVFQIWVKKITDRKLPVKVTEKNYKFVKRNENPDISFRRVGGTAGAISKDTKDKSEQSHNFITFDIKLTDEKYKELSNIKFGCKNNTVGPKSISKQEIIREFNKIL